MGAVADSALEAGGEVIGIIPEALVGAVRGTAPARWLAGAAQRVRR